MNIEPISDDKVKEWLAKEQSWLVRNVSGKVTVSDVKYPFDMSWDSWVNLLGVCSYKDIVYSDQLLSLYKSGLLECNPHFLYSIIFAMRNKPSLIPQTPPLESEPAPRDWQLTKIPKIIHFYWGNKTISFLRFMSLYSFKKFNPDWKICLHVPTKYNKVQGGSDTDPWCRSVEDTHLFSGLDYYPYVSKLGVTILPFDCSSIGIQSSIPEVHKSDFLRWRLLGTTGGVWSDMDILYFRPITCLSFNYLEYTDHNGFVYIKNGEHKIGFLMSTGNNCFFNNVLEIAKTQYNKRICQTVGSDLLDKHYPTIESINKTGFKAVSIDDDPVYWLKHLAVYYSFYDNGLEYMKKGSIGLHWYAGCIHARKIINEVSHHNYMGLKNESTIVQILKKYFSEGIRL